MWLGTGLMGFSLTCLLMSFLSLVTGQSIVLFSLSHLSDSWACGMFLRIEQALTTQRNSLKCLMSNPLWSSGEESACQYSRCSFNPWVREDPLKEEVAIRFHIMAWEIPWAEEPGELQPIGLQRVRYNWVAECVHAYTQTHTDTDTHRHTHRDTHRHTHRHTHTHTALNKLGRFPLFPFPFCCPSPRVLQETLLLSIPLRFETAICTVCRLS